MSRPSGRIIRRIVLSVERASSLSRHSRAVVAPFFLPPPRPRAQFPRCPSPLVTARRYSSSFLRSARSERDLDRRKIDSPRPRRKTRYRTDSADVGTPNDDPGGCRRDGSSRKSLIFSSRNSQLSSASRDRIRPTVEPRTRRSILIPLDSRTFIRRFIVLRKLFA